MARDFWFSAFLILVAVLGTVGWVANIVKLIYMIGSDVTTMFIVRIVGVFAAPLGAILGYL